MQSIQTAEGSKKNSLKLYQETMHGIKFVLSTVDDINIRLFQNELTSFNVLFDNICILRLCFIINCFICRPLRFLIVYSRVRWFTFIDIFVFCRSPLEIVTVHSL